MEPNTDIKNVASIRQTMFPVYNAKQLEMLLKCKFFEKFLKIEI